jgi:tetratricopeptide (TPR) repeat protein
MASSESNRLEDIIIIWLDENVASPEKLLSSQRKTLLLSYIKSIRPFINCSECREYIEKMNNVRIFFVVSGSLGEKIVSVIHDLPQVTFIYIFCADKSKHEIWAKQFNKIRGVFNDDVPLSIKVKDDVCSLSNVTFPFGLFDSTQQSLQDLSKEQASFMWFQLLTEVLLRLPQTPEAKAEMVTECRATYKENEAQLEKITIFDKIYKTNDAIKWYTDNTFVFQLFNKAFRKQDFDVIFKYRYFLVDLYNQLALLYNQQHKDQEGHLTVYRGQMMFRDELMKLKQNVGHLISINTFFSTSISCMVAANFSGNGEQQSIGIVSVIFEITVDLKVPCRPFANIAQLSSIKDENEILFSIGTIFRIESVDLEIDTIWLVKLTWTNDCNEKLKEMKQLTGLLDFYTGQNIGDHPSVLTFGLFLSKMGLLRQALRFYVSLRKILPFDHPDRGVLFNNLGEVLRKLNYFNQARCEFEMALEHCTDTMSIFHPFWGILHSNMALLELTCGRPEQALKFYRCALLIINKLHEGDDWQITYVQEALASVYHGMASAYYYLDQYQQALQLNQKALQIELRILPHDHPTLMESYHELGNVNIKLNNFTKALEDYEESLRISQKNLLVNDWRFVSLHINIAILTYNVHKNIPKTLIHCTYALQLMENSTFALTSHNRMVIYKTLAYLYTHIGLGHLAFQMWEQFIKAGKDRLIADNDTVDFSDMMRQMNTLESSKQNFDPNAKFMILVDDKCLSTPSLSHLEMITRCEIADKWRAMGQIKAAIGYYTWLLEKLPMPDDPQYDKLHKSRLHNNLAACYQDLDDNQAALHHYRLSLDILSPTEEHKSMQAAIVHYNIALIYTDCDELHEAKMHLDKSLLHYMGSSRNKNSILDVQIYIAFANIYERCNDWQMARDYYQRVIDQCKQDAASQSIIDKYEQRLQNVIDKINKIT